MRTAVVTGAARGFGLSVARELTASGWKVFACARNATDRHQLQRLVTETDRVEPIRLDVTDDRDRYRLRQILRTTVTSVDLVVNNAGVNAGTMQNPAAHRRLTHLDGDGMSEMFRVNTIAPVLIVQSVVELLRNADRPRVVNVSSRAGSIAEKDGGGNYSYAASKAALNMMTRALDGELDTVTVVSVHPGRLRTRMGGPTAPDDPEEAAADLVELVEELSDDHSGSFLTRHGTPIPW